MAVSYGAVSAPTTKVTPQSTTAAGRRIVAALGLGLALTVLALLNSHSAPMLSNMSTKSGGGGGGGGDHPCASPDICDPKQCRSDKDARKPVCKKCLECHNAHNKGKDGDDDAKCTPHCRANGKNNEAFCENPTASHFKNKAACEGSGGKCHFNDCGGD